MRRAWDVYRMFAATSLRRELEFRANFLAKMGQTFVWQLFSLGMILVIFHRIPTIAGWTRKDAILLMGTVHLISAVYRMIFPSLSEMPELVRRGNLDFVVTRPVDSQLWVSFRKVGWEQIGPLMAALATVAYGVWGEGVTPLDMIGYGLALSGAMALFYAMNLALATSAIWFVRVDNLFVLTEMSTEIARFPLDIYGRNVQAFLVYVLPLAILGSVPVHQLTKGVNWFTVALCVGWGVVSLWAVRRFWTYAAKAYASASS